MNTSIDTPNVETIPQMSAVERYVIRQRHALADALRVNRQLKAEIRGLKRRLLRLDPKPHPADLACAANMIAALDDQDAGASS